MSKHCFFHGVELEHLGSTGGSGSFTSAYYCKFGDHHFTLISDANETRLLLESPYKDSFEKEI